jgi:hypothetical protein
MAPRFPITGRRPFNPLKEMSGDRKRYQIVTKIILPPQG